jgi:fibronectin type 3 domain-containing protein
MKSKICCAVFLLVWLLTISANAAPKLIWDPSADPQVSGYKVYFSDLTGGNGGSWNAGPNCEVPLNLQAGHTYSFTVTAYDADGLESDPSTPLQYYAPAAPSSLAVSWDPSAYSSIASYTLYYGVMNQTAQPLSAGLQTSASLTNLERGTTYYLYVIGRNASSNTVDSWQQVTVSIPSEGDPTPVHIRRVNQTPQVTLTSPTALASYTLPAAVSLAATALDPDGTIASVEFFVGSTRIATCLSAPYLTTWTGQAAGTYQITALARDAQGATRSASVQITLREAVPSAPANLAATPTEDAVRLTWSDTSANELGFRIYRLEGSNYMQISYVAANTVEYLDDLLTPGTTYSYRVTAYNGAGESGAAQIAATTLQILPPPPGSIAARAIAGGIEVTWSLCEGAAQYQLQRSLSPGGPFATISTTAAGYFLDANVQPETAYYYQVLAEAGSYRSTPSPVAFAIAAGSPPTAPSNLKASASGKTQINLSWRDNSNNETSFVVERSFDNVNFATITTLSANSTAFADGTVAPRRRYYYRVRAQNGAGASYSLVVATKTR